MSSSKSRALAIFGSFLAAFLLLLALQIPTQSQGFNAFQQTTFSSVTVGATMQENSTILFHQLAWTGTPSTCQVSIDSSADGSAWSVGGILAAQTCTSPGSSAVTSGNAAFVRVNVSTFSGTPVVISYTGWALSPGNAPAGCSAAAGVLTCANFVSTVATGTQPYAATSTTNNTNLNASSLTVAGRIFTNPGPIGSVTPAAGTFTSLSETSLLCNTTAPTVASGFSGTAPTLVVNGNCGFNITINATPSSTGTLTFPAAAHAWHVMCDDLTTQTATVYRTVQTGAVSTTSVVLTQLTDVGATGTAWNQNDILACTAIAY